jgi:hypothetical protein
MKHKSAIVFFILMAGTLAIFQSCGDKGVQINTDPMVGKIGGQDWTFKFGNAYLETGDLKYRLRFLGMQESGEDPCPIVGSGNPHMEMLTKITPSSRSLPLPVFSESLKFVLGNGTVYSATSGFIEITLVDNLIIYGYLQAIFDDNNSVQGSFRIRICN